MKKRLAVAVARAVTAAAAVSPSPFRTDFDPHSIVQFEQAMRRVRFAIRPDDSPDVINVRQDRKNRTPIDLSILHPDELQDLHTRAIVAEHAWDTVQLGGMVRNWLDLPAALRSQPRSTFGLPSEMTAVKLQARLLSPMPRPLVTSLAAFDADVKKFGDFCNDTIELANAVGWQRVAGGSPKLEPAIERDDALNLYFDLASHAIADAARAWSNGPENFAMLHRTGEDLLRTGKRAAFKHGPEMLLN